ncbi:MAG: hypothetical protein ABS49_08070 [Erythrobacter sp. SCN 62-14]|nr:MAG: hypothetical protein ABS49_08070 [Erythrobacter sp. SCN 62-14]
MKRRFANWISGFRQPTKVSLTALLFVAFLAGLFGEGLKLGGKVLEEQCAANESAVANLEILTALHAIELQFVEQKNGTLVERISELPDKDEEVGKISEEVRVTSKQIAAQKRSLSDTRQNDLPRLSDQTSEICYKARFFDRLASFVSGIFTLILTIYLFYLGILVSDLSSRQQRQVRNDDSDHGIAPD